MVPDYNLVAQVFVFCQHAFQPFTLNVPVCPLAAQGFGIRFITRDVIALKHDKLGCRRHPPERGIDLSEVPLVPLARYARAAIAVEHKLVFLAVR